MARVFQDTRQKRELGRKAPWYVEWRAGGKRHSRKIGGKMAADEFAREIDAQVMREEFNLARKKTWAEFREEYETIVVPRMRSKRSREEAYHSLNTFERLVDPIVVRGIDRKLLDQYVATRSRERGKKKNSVVSAETIRKEIRTIRSALRQAHEWGYLPVVPSMPKVSGLTRDKRFVTIEHYQAIWNGTVNAHLPSEFDCPANWWRALLKVFWITGVRVGSILTARWDDLNTDRGVLVLHAQNTKQKKDHILHVDQAVPELLKIRQLKDGYVFPWNHHRRTLDVEWHRIQRSVGIYLPCPGADEHQCTDACHMYGFHDLRRAHATYNYGRVEDRELQQQMGHGTFQTTQRYILFAEKMSRRGYNAFLPNDDESDFANVKSTCEADVG